MTYKYVGVKGLVVLTHNLKEVRKYEGDPRSNANYCVISFTIAIFQDSLHQNNDALSIFPDYYFD